MEEKDIDKFELFFKSRQKCFKNKLPLRSYQDFFGGYFEGEEERKNGKIDVSAEEELNFLLEIDLCIPENLHHLLEDFPIPASKYVIR